MDHVATAWAPVVRSIVTHAWGRPNAPEDVLADCAAFLDAVQRGCPVLPEVPWSTAALCRRAAMRLAIWNDHVQTVRSLLQVYAGNWHANWTCDLSPLHQAAAYGSVCAAAALLEAKAGLDATCRGNTPLVIAAENGLSCTVTFLLARKARVNATREKGALQAAAAAHEANTNVVALLLKANAQVNARDWRGTALCCAAGAGNVDTVRFLLQEGKAEVDRTGGPLQRTPLHFAVPCQQTRAVALLLEAKADVNRSDNQGWTILHDAVNAHDVHMLSILLQAQADVEARSQSGCTVLSLCNRYRNVTSRNMLSLLQTGQARAPRPSTEHAH